MPNPDHLDLPRQGVQVWNHWRREEPKTVPDLSDAALGGWWLGGANLADVDLKRADLRGADFLETELYAALLDSAVLAEAVFNKTNLRWAHLDDAVLTRASFLEARLHQTSLVRADFSSALIVGTSFWQPTLNETNLSDAELDRCTFAAADLSKVIGLETVQHTGPSTVGIDTIYLSKGNIPETFLRGAGVPDDFITYVRSLAAHPIEFDSCFISYSTKDDDFAHGLHAGLQQANVRCWFAPEDLKIGDKFRTRIDESIRLYDKLMVILTEHSIASPWVEEEVEAALEKERKSGKAVLFPIRLDDAVMETDQAWASGLRRTRHIGDFRNWKDHDAFKKAFEQLLRDLKTSDK